jgi:hypothetical protein
VEVVVGVIMRVGRTTRSWIHAESVTLQKKARERGDPSAPTEEKSRAPARWPGAVMRAPHVFASSLNG